MIPTSTRRRIEKKTTSQSSAKAPSYTMGAVKLSTGPLPNNQQNRSRRGNKQTKQATHAPVTKVNKQTNKQVGAACAKAWMQGVVQSCVTCRVQYTMHQSTQKSFGDALEMHQRSMEFDTQGCTLTSPPS